MEALCYLENTQTVTDLQSSNWCWFGSWSCHFCIKVLTGVTRQTFYNSCEVSAWQPQKSRSTAKILQIPRSKQSEAFRIPARFLEHGTASGVRCSILRFGVDNMTRFPREPWVAMIWQMPFWHLISGLKFVALFGFVNQCHTVSHSVTQCRLASANSVKSRKATAPACGVSRVPCSWWLAHCQRMFAAGTKKPKRQKSKGKDSLKNLRC